MKIQARKVEIGQLVWFDEKTPLICIGIKNEWKVFLTNDGVIELYGSLVTEDSHE